MSAKARRARDQQDEDKRFAQSVQSGLRFCLNHPDGRAFLWWLYAIECRTEGAAELGQRAVGMALAAQAKLSDFDAWQIMREENERPKLRSELREEAEAEGDA